MLNKQEGIGHRKPGGFPGIWAMCPLRGPTYRLMPKVFRNFKNGSGKAASSIAHYSFLSTHHNHICVIFRITQSPNAKISVLKTATPIVPYSLSILYAFLGYTRHIPIASAMFHIGRKIPNANSSTKPAMAAIRIGSIIVATLSTIYWYRS